MSTITINSGTTFTLPADWRGVANSVWNYGAGAGAWSFRSGGTGGQ